MDNTYSLITKFEDSNYVLEVLIDWCKSDEYNYWIENKPFPDEETILNIHEDIKNITQISKNGKGNRWMYRLCVMVIYSLTQNIKSKSNIESMFNEWKLYIPNRILLQGPLHTKCICTQSGIVNMEYIMNESKIFLPIGCECSGKYEKIASQLSNYRNRQMKLVDNIKNDVNVAENILKFYLHRFHYEKLLIDDPNFNDKAPIVRISENDERIGVIEKLLITTKFNTSTMDDTSLNLFLDNLINVINHSSNDIDLNQKYCIDCNKISEYDRCKKCYSNTKDSTKKCQSCDNIIPALYNTCFSCKNKLNRVCNMCSISILDLPFNYTKCKKCHFSTTPSTAVRVCKSCPTLLASNAPSNYVMCKNCCSKFYNPKKY